jgi:dTDP-N-acetylfucosamine:lipid II N-acetylfucosaminyltransferase
MAYQMKINSLENKILHIVVLDKFIPPFIDIIKEAFDINEHIFVALEGKRYDFGLTDEHPIKWIDSPEKITYLTQILHLSKKIIIHGLWNDIFGKLLYAMPWLLEKCYWVIWGGDLYFHRHEKYLKNYKEREFVRKYIIQRMGNIITYIYGDYKLAKKWYSTTANFIKCFMYPSNIYNDFAKNRYTDSYTNILIGNSASTTNNHIDAFRLILPFRNKNIRIICPLSYGDKKYAQLIATYGKEIFGSKFYPLIDFLELEKYLNILNNIDIVLFPHNRQQAFGNTITLLGMGKKLYMRSDVTHWKTLKELDLSVYNIFDFNLNRIDEKDKIKNQNIIREEFSKSNLLKSLSRVFS